MKLFIYKTIIVVFVSFVLFEVTIGHRVNKFNAEIETILSKKNREEIILKIKDEIKEANTKENILDDEEREILSTFIKKIINELDLR